MSTLKVESIQHPSSSTPAISLDSNGAMTGSFPAPNRNILYNGAMQVAQRATSVTGFPASGGSRPTVDRWNSNNASPGTWTVTQDSNAPEGYGFRKSHKFLCTAANANTGNITLRIGQALEGQDLQKIKKGTVNAEKLTLSFWVKSNVTGTYVSQLNDVDNSRTVSATYSISFSDTWEKKIIVFPEDTSGLFDNDNNKSLELWFYLVAEGTFVASLPENWTVASINGGAQGQVNVGESINNYWQITGVQLETGPVATEFEFEPYGVTLAKCQRYYQKSFPINTTPADNAGIEGSVGSTNSSTQNFFSVAQVNFPVQMRANPTITYFNPSAVNANKIRDAGGLNYPAYTQIGPNTRGFTVGVNNSSFNGSGTLGFVHYTAESEL